MPKWKHKRSSGKRNGKHAAAHKKMNVLIQSIASRYLMSVSKEQRKKLERDIRLELNVKKKAELDSIGLWKALDESDHRLVIENADENYLQAFTIAWKIHDYISSSEKRLKAEIPRLAKRAGMKITAKFDPLIATFRSTIKYGDRRLWSRDAQAVRWLQRKKQTPDTVIEYRKKFRGGVDKWARKEQNRRKSEKLKAGGTPEPERKTAADRIAALRKKLQDGEGAVLLVKKKDTALLSIGYITIQNASKKLHWSKIVLAINGTKSIKP